MSERKSWDTARSAFEWCIVIKFVSLFSLSYSISVELIEGLIFQLLLNWRFICGFYTSAPGCGLRQLSFPVVRSSLSSAEVTFSAYHRQAIDIDKSHGIPLGLSMNVGGITLKYWTNRFVSFKMTTYLLVSGLGRLWGQSGKRRVEPNFRGFFPKADLQEGTWTDSNLLPQKILYKSSPANLQSLCWFVYTCKHNHVKNPEKRKRFDTIDVMK